MTPNDAIQLVCFSNVYKCKVVWYQMVLNGMVSRQCHDSGKSDYLFNLKIIQNLPLISAPLDWYPPIVMVCP